MVEIREEDMLEFLMNSEFIDTYKPEEYKYFLSKFKYYYRILHGRSSSDLTDLRHKNSHLVETNKSINSENELLKNENISFKKIIVGLKNPRKLSMSERIFGKTNQL